MNLNANSNVDELLMLNHDAIDYQKLPDDVLRELALEVEPFIATSALSELSIRRSELAGNTAWTLLTRPESDRHLRAAALGVLFKFDPDRAATHMRDRLAECDAGLTATMMEIVLENREFFAHGPFARLPHELATCVEGEQRAAPSADPDVTHLFLRLFGRAGIA